VACRREVDLGDRVDDGDELVGPYIGEIWAGRRSIVHFSKKTRLLARPARTGPRHRHHGGSPAEVKDDSALLLIYQWRSGVTIA